MGPWGLPIIGYLPFLGPQPQETFLCLRKKYGDIFTIRMGSFTVVVVNGYDKIKETLVTNAGVFDTRPDFFTFSKLKDRLAFGEYGDRWIVLKKILINRFNNFINNKHYPLDGLLADESNCFIADVMKYNGRPFDPKMDFYVTFCSVIYQIVYGRGENVREDKDFLEVIVREKEFIDFATSGNPVEVMPWLSGVCPCLGKKVLDLKDYLERLRTNKVSEHMKSFNKDYIRDLTDSLIGLMDKTPEMETVGLEFKHIVTLLDELIPAAFDTTATTMRWIILCLVNIPFVQKKMFEEIDRVVGDRTPILSDRQKMPYTEAVILEGMRFKTPIPLSLPHAAVKNAKLSGYDIPKGTTILLNLHSVTRDAKVWTYPNAFYPEHFLTSNGELDRDKAVLIFPFGLGKRKCVGEKLARDNLFIALVSMVQRFRILPVNGEEYNMTGLNGLTDCPKPYKIIAEPR